VPDFFFFPYVLGFLHDYYGSYEIPAIVVSIINGIGFLALILLYIIDAKDGGKMQRNIGIDDNSEEGENENEPLITK